MPNDPAVVDISLFAIGWSIGWFLLWNARSLPPTITTERTAVTVVIPARNEAHALSHLLQPLVDQRRRGDRIIVVDDHSTDGTAAIAREHGAEVITAAPLQDGWLGKPNACFAGAQASTGDILVFLDADVRPGPTLLDDLAAQVTDAPDTVISVQPWHRMDTPGEQASLLCNVTALMGCGAFTPFAHRTAANVAFGPVLAVARSTYDRVGGHAHPDVRAKHTEDIALARTIGRSRLFVGAPDSTTFRMYPSGMAELVRGWTRSFADGARSTRWWLTLATAGWLCSVAGGWIAIPWAYPLIALQIWILGRRAGTTRLLAALLFPLLVVVFVAIVVRSAITLLTGRAVTWKGRHVDPRGR
ncbi:glycosyltransferase [Ilumatobacter nonamiensis]|uniref:glycosyltransferase n=1 Tax=Ilumatobacter nonamiensis TaxID=467093 RepID=UPI00130D52E3|nr:glycosyltransferase family 2 protein [Ilumatobacter nonamiensis]